MFSNFLSRRQVFGQKSLRELFWKVLIKYCMGARFPSSLSYYCKIPLENFLRLVEQKRLAENNTNRGPFN